MSDGGDLSVKGSYVEKGRPKTTRPSKNVKVKVSPKSKQGHLSFNIPVDNRYIKSIGGGVGGGKHSTKVDVSVMDDPVFKETVKFVHRNAAARLGLNPKKMPLNLQSLEVGYEDFKNVLKNSAGTEDRQTGTGYNIGASFKINDSGSLDIRFAKTPSREKRGRVDLRYKFEEGGIIKKIEKSKEEARKAVEKMDEQTQKNIQEKGMKQYQPEMVPHESFIGPFYASEREKEMKILSDSGFDTEFQMHIDPYILKDFLAQYGSEVKTQMLDPTAKKKDMFSTVHIRDIPRHRLGGAHVIPFREKDLANLKAIEEYAKRLPNEPVDPSVAKLKRRLLKRLSLTPYDIAETTGLEISNLKETKPPSFMPLTDTTFVNLRKATKEKPTGTEQPLATPETTATVFIHEARHKGVSDLQLHGEIKEALPHIPLDPEGTPYYAEEVLMRFMDYQHATTPEAKEEAKNMLISYYAELNRLHEEKPRRFPANPKTWSGLYIHPFSEEEGEGRREFARLEELAEKVNEIAKERLAELRGVPVYESDEYEPSYWDKLNRQGFLKATFGD